MSTTTTKRNSAELRSLADFLEAKPQQHNQHAWALTPVEGYQPRAVAEIGGHRMWITEKPEIGLVAEANTVEELLAALMNRDPVACGTVCCAAGWTVLRNLDNPDVTGDIEGAAQLVLGLTRDEAKMLFASTRNEATMPQLLRLIADNRRDVFKAVCAIEGHDPNEVTAQDLTDI